MSTTEWINDNHSRDCILVADRKSIYDVLWYYDNLCEDATREKTRTSLLCNIDNPMPTEKHIFLLIFPSLGVNIITKFVDFCYNIECCIENFLLCMYSKRFRPGSAGFSNAWWRGSELIKRRILPKACSCSSALYFTYGFNKFI